MPWDAASFAKHNGKLDRAKSAHAARIANAVLKKSGDEGMAIAVANKAAQKFAFGGPVRGFLAGGTPGRADAIRTSAEPDSYVIPADVVSGVGQGNSGAGRSVLEKAFNSGPYGVAAVGPYGVDLKRFGRSTSIPSPPRVQAQAAGGSVVPVALSDGEFVVPPHEVARRGGGDVGKGKRWFDRWVMQQRRANIGKLKKLPRPAGAS